MRTLYSWAKILRNITSRLARQKTTHAAPAACVEKPHHWWSCLYIVKCCIDFVFHHSVKHNVFDSLLASMVRNQVQCMVQVVLSEEHIIQHCYFIRFVAQLHSAHMLQPAACVLLFCTYWPTQLDSAHMLQSAACVHYVAGQRFWEISLLG